KFPKAFLCLVGLSRHYTLDEETYPRFLPKNGEGGNGYFCFHPYPGSYQIAPDRVDNELEASVERLLDEGGSGTQTEQRDSARGGLDANIHPVVKAANTIVKDAALVQARRQGKRKSMVVDAGGVSCPPKKLREDHGTLSGAFVGGKSPSVLQRLLAEAMLNAEVRAAAISTLPFVTAYVSTTQKREDGDPTYFMAEPNLRTIGASQRFIISSDSSHHSGPTIAEAEVDSLVSITNGSRLDDGRVCREMVDEFTHPKFFASVRGIEHDQLFTEFNVGSARQMSLSVEARDGEIENLKAQLLLKAMEAAKATRLCAQTSNLEVVEKSLQDEVNALKGRNDILEKERNALDVKVIDLEASVVGKECDLTDLNAQLTSVKSQNDNLANRVHELEISSVGLQEKITVDGLSLGKKIYPHLLNAISGRRWLLTHSLKLFLVKCLNSSEYLTNLGAAISRAIEKGMQSGLATAVDHGREGRSLADVASYKDASTEDIMNVLCPKGALADASRMNDLQPDIEQLKVPIHRYEDQVVLGETSLLFSLSISHSRVKQIRENIAAQRSALVGVWTPLSEPLSVTSLMGKASTSGVVLADSMTTTALSTTFASASSIHPIFIDDYEIVGVDGQEGAGTNG
nr:hypothetical protein [Tanacetum cinerariifolium]